MPNGVPVRSTGPLGRIGGGLDVAAPDELGVGGPREHRDAAGPEQDALMVRSRREAMASRSTRLGKAASTSEASGRLPVETTSDPGGIALGELGHPARDSAADRRKIVGEQQVGPHPDNLAKHRREPSHEAAGGGRNREMVNRARGRAPDRSERATTASAMAAGSSGGTRRAARPTNSRWAGMSDATTGVPDASASIGPRPNPSNRLGHTATLAVRYACSTVESSAPVSTEARAQLGSQAPQAPLFRAAANQADLHPITEQGSRAQHRFLILVDLEPRNGEQDRRGSREPELNRNRYES